MTKGQPFVERMLYVPAFRISGLIISRAYKTFFLPVLLSCLYVMSGFPLHPGGGAYAAVITILDPDFLWQQI